jgi:hypothetical protein
MSLGTQGFSKNNEEGSFAMVMIEAMTDPQSQKDTLLFL